MTLPLAISSNFIASDGNAAFALQMIARAGFSHVMWAHHWCTDFIYSRSEIDMIRIWLKKNHLQLHDIHGSHGREKCCYSLEEYRRRAGVDMLINRLEMMDSLGASGVVVMHQPRIQPSTLPDIAVEQRRRGEMLRRSLDEVMPLLEKFDRRIALENLPGDTWEILGGILRDYPAERIGLCLDSGHCNLALRPHHVEVEKFRERIIAVHLHDNDGTTDQHGVPFSGNFDWQWLASVLKDSPLPMPPVFELSFRKSRFCTDAENIEESAVEMFLAEARERCSRFARMLVPEV